jgi:hypothetical protein
MASFVAVALDGIASLFSTATAASAVAAAVLRFSSHRPPSPSSWYVTRTVDPESLSELFLMSEI